MDGEASIILKEVYLEEWSNHWVLVEQRDFERIGAYWDWKSICQRAGSCNNRGEIAQGQLQWRQPYHPLGSSWCDEENGGGSGKPCIRQWCVDWKWVWSPMITPRLVIWSEILISASAILIDGMVGKVWRRWWVPKSIASDLSGLRQRPLKQSQDRKADRHASKRSTDSVVSLRVRPMYSCASSAYCWWEMPWSETICPTGRNIQRKK